MANNLTLGQSAQTGKWTVSIKHGYAGINIPVTLKYNNAQPVTLNVGTAYNPVETDWVTDIGVAIDTTKITASGSVVCGETTYQVVNPVQWEAVTPASGGTGSTATLSISASPLNVNASGHTGVTLTIESNTGWTLESMETWATISGGTSGANNATRKLRISENTSLSNRTVEVKVTGGGLQRSVYIVQSGVTPYIRITGPSSVSANGGTITVNIESNTGWTVATNVVWAQVTGNPSGSGSNQRSIEISPNESQDSRSVTITAYNGSLQNNITLTQSGSEIVPYINLSSTATTESVQPSGGTVVISVDSNTGWTLSVAQTAQEYASITSPSGSGVANKQMTVYPNTGTEPRNIRVYAKSNDAGQSITKYIDITQLGVAPLLYFNDRYPALQAVDWDAGSRFYSVSLSANIAWTIQSSANWMTIEDMSGNPITGGSGNMSGIYLSFQNNTGDTDRSLTITLSPADSSLGVQSDTLQVTQTAKINEFAVILNECGSSALRTSYESGTFGTDCFAVSANTYWHLYSPETWIGFQPVNGNSTHTEPDGKKAFVMTKTENVTVSERTAVVQLCEGINIGDNSSVFDTITITQERGLSWITLNGDAVLVPAESSVQTFTVVSNQRWYVASYGNLTPSGFTSSTKFSSGTTTIAFTVPENTDENNQKHYTIVVKTDDTQQFEQSESYSFDQMQATAHGYVRLSKDGIEHPAFGNIEYKRDGFSDGDGQQASAHTLYFYLETNTQSYVEYIECYHGEDASIGEDNYPTEAAALHLYDSHGNEITAGQPSQMIQPTSGYERFEVRLPANTRLGSHIGTCRRFKVHFKTTDYNLWRGEAEMIILQFGDEYFMTNPHWSTDVPTAYTGNDALESRAYTWAYDGSQDTSFKPALLLVATKYNASATYSQEVPIGDDVQYGYIDANCGLRNDRISVTYPDWFYGYETPIAEQGSFCPSAQTPYAFNVKKNQKWCPETGTSRFGQIQVTYSFGGDNPVFTIEVEQKYDCVPAPELGLDLYVQSIYGGQQAAVKEDDVNLLQSDRTVRFSLVGSFSEGEITYGVNGDTSKFTGQCVFGHDYFDAQTGNTQGDNFYVNQWPGHNFDAIFKVKNTVTSDFDIMITGAKTADPMVKTNLILHVHV